jgi:hypothetical protein
MNRHRLTTRSERVRLTEFVLRERRHLGYDRACLPLHRIAEELGISKRTLMGHLKALPEIAAALATSRTHQRGGPRRKIVTGADF